MPDDYPTSSEVWRVEPPKERIEAEQDEKSKIVTSIGVIGEVIEWFEAQSNFYAHVDALGIDERTPDDAAKLLVLLSKKMRGAFQEKANEFATRFEQYIQEVPDKS